MSKRIKIEFYNNQAEGRLTCVGLGTFPCLGQSGLHYPRDLTIDPRRRGVKQDPHYSQTYSCFPDNNAAGQCRMRYSILIWGQNGVYIHGWPTAPTYVGNGSSDTHGCIHLSMKDAKTVYHWVDTRTRVTISYPW